VRERPGISAAADTIMDVSLSVHAITLDSREPVALADFWARAFGGTVRDSGNGYLAVEPVPGLAGPLLIQPVTDDRPAKNPIHLDLGTDDTGGELARLVGLGATVIEERADSKFRWWVLADPEGNLFCLG
jgi:predicted enzyme related to lactoylglutathione lyase